MRSDPSVKQAWPSLVNEATLQEINISHLGKGKIIFKMPFLGDIFCSLEGMPFESSLLCHSLRKSSFGQSPLAMSAMQGECPFRIMGAQESRSQGVEIYGITFIYIYIS